MAYQYVLISNFINHHQIPFCDAMMELTGGSFAFIQVEPMSEERKNMGWGQEKLPDYVVLAYENREQAMTIIAEAGVVIYGGAEDESYISPRLQAGKKVLRYSERLYRTGQWKAISPRGLRRKYLDHTRYRRKDVHLLCAGAYVPSDFHIVRAYPKKMLRFGYFPKLREYEDVEQLIEEKDPLEILWVARLIPLKHPEYAVETAKYLKDKGVPFRLKIIGGGEMEEALRDLIKQYGLTEEVTMCGFMSPEEVRDHMEKASIFLMTSNKEEGWGAVINEALNSACPVIANYAIGAVPFLITPEKNGYVYRNKEQLFAYTQKLLLDSETRKHMGKNAYETIANAWNAKEAARRLTLFCEQGVVQTDDGPCSAAPVVGEGRMYHYLQKKSKQ